MGVWKIPCAEFVWSDERNFLGSFLGGQLLRRLTYSRLSYASWRAYLVSIQNFAFWTATRCDLVPWGPLFTASARLEFWLPEIISFICEADGMNRQHENPHKSPQGIRICFVCLDSVFISYK